MGTEEIMESATETVINIVPFSLAELNYYNEEEMERVDSYRKCSRVD